MWTCEMREYHWTPIAKLQNNSLYESWTCIKLSNVHEGPYRKKAGMKDLLTNLGNFVPGTVGCGVRPLKWQKCSMWACKMTDCLRYSYLCVSIAFNFIVHLKIRVTNTEKKKKIISFEIGSCASRRNFYPPHLASYLALGRSWLIPKERVSECGVIQWSYPSWL